MRKSILILLKVISIISLVILSSCDKKEEEIYTLSNTLNNPIDINIKRGFNLGNSLDCLSKNYAYTIETEEFWGNPKTDKALIDYIASLGFDSIRIPVSYYNHIDENNMIDIKWLERIQELVDYSLDNNLYIIINIHHDTGMDPKLNWIYADSDNFIDNNNKYINLWKQIASYFKDYDHRLLFQSSGEWMNPERNWDRDKSYDDFKIVHDLNQSFINTVRESGSNNKDRYLLISPFSASGEKDIIEAMFYKEFIDTIDNKLILSVHSYLSDVSLIYQRADELIEVANKHNIPVILDEFGFKVTDNKKDSLKALKAFIDISNKANIPLFYWDDGYGYKLIDRNNKTIFDKDILDLYLVK